MIAFLLHGATLSLAWFVAVNVATTMAVMVTVSVASRSAARGARMWLCLRLAPAGVSLGFVLLIFIPSYVLYEPRQAVEGFDVTLTAVACCATAAVVPAIARAAGAWRSARARAAAWLRTARPLALACDLPVFQLDTDAPMMALVGLRRPRLIVTRGIVEALTEPELAASVQHEVGHARARDNLKRLCIRAAPDFLGATAAARLLESRWVSAAEHAADRHGSRDSEMRCALASALVKVARLAPSLRPAGEPISTLVDGGDIAARVRTLLDDGAPPIDAGSMAEPFAWAVLATAGAAAYHPVLRIVHAATELLVNTLP